MAVARIDFHTIVHRAAERVEREDGVMIDGPARDLLIRRAEDHAEDVRKALQNQGLCVSNLEDAAAKQFREAKRGSGFVGRNITMPAVDAGMKRRCHFVPWC